jgi:hypothetical protein
MRLLRRSSRQSPAKSHGELVGIAPEDRRFPLMADERSGNRENEIASEIHTALSEQGALLDMSGMDMTETEAKSGMIDLMKIARKLVARFPQLLR